MRSTDDSSSSGTLRMKRLEEKDGRDTERTVFQRFASGLQRKAVRLFEPGQIIQYLLELCLGKKGGDNHEIVIAVAIRTNLLTKFKRAKKK